MKHLKMAQQGQPTNNFNHEIRSIPRNADPQFAYIRLRYDWSTEQDIDPTSWQPHLLAFRGTDAYSGIDRKDARLQMEVHIVPIESIPADEPTDEIMHDARNDQLHIRLTYDVRGISESKTMHERSQVVHFSREYPFEDLFHYLAKFVTAYLAAKEPKFHTYLGEQDKEQFLLFRPVLRHSCPLKQRAFTFDDSSIARLHSIGDLLRDTGTAGAAETGVKPQFDIRLELIELLRRESTDPMVVIRSGAETRDRGGLSQFFRIGSVSSTAAEYTETPTVPTSDMFFWRCVGDMEVTTLAKAEPTLMKVPKWTIGGLEVSNPDEGEPTSKDTLGPIDHIHRDLKYTDGIQGLYDRFNDHQIDAFTDGRLLYSFKTFGQTVQCPQPLTSFPSSNVSLALRFFNHLKSERASKLLFSNIVELEIDNSDDHNSISKAILKGFKTASHANTKALLKAPLKDQFDLQLWVLPQIPDGRTLFRYGDSATALHSFLNKPDVRKGNLSLFMEVHLVDKVKEVSEKTKEKTSRRTKSDRYALRR
jgi:hypothetical protein